MKKNNKLIRSIVLIASLSFFFSFSSSTGYASSVDEQSLNRFSNQVETLVELSIDNEIKPLYSEIVYEKPDLGGSHPGYSGPGPCGCATPPTPTPPTPTPPHNPNDPTPARP